MTAGKNGPALAMNLVQASDGEGLYQYHRSNLAHLQPWAPLREPGWHSLARWHKRAEGWAVDYHLGRGACFVGRFPGESEVIALASLSQIMRGAFQACYLGYSIHHEYQGRGLMRGFVDSVVAHAFGQLRLNRVMANYMPANQRSERLLQSLGFEREGFAVRYLKINGRWEDHVLTAKVAPVDA